MEALLPSAHAKRADQPCEILLVLRPDTTKMRLEVFATIDGARNIEIAAGNATGSQIRSPFDRLAEAREKLHQTDATLTHEPGLRQKRDSGALFLFATRRHRVRRVVIPRFGRGDSRAVYPSSAAVLLARNAVNSP
jgi:hypothetical protein